MAIHYITPIQLPLAIEGATAEIPLTQGRVATVDAIDADLIDILWHVLTWGHSSYAYCYLDKLNKPMHRLILARELGRELLPKEFVDHINGDGLDNRRINLRIATHQQNIRNQRLSKANTSGYKGVSKRNKRWGSCISVDGKTIHLGRFDTPEEAHEAYCQAARKYFGEFARSE